MRISLQWLNDFIRLKDSEKLIRDLSLFGFTVESQEKYGRDTILDLEINPNRGDCLSILGIAREVAAIYDIKLKTPAFAKASAVMQKQYLKAKIKKDEDNSPPVISVRCSRPEICPRFTARVIDNTKIGPSPEWMKKRLIGYGFRPINNIVDITNYVMIETGQPLHAFDFEKISEGRMEINLSQGNEKLTTLDGVSRVLPEDAIIIKDEEKVYDLAGIMGGLNSEVDSKTKTIVLQGAIFDKILIRRASKKIGLTTEASYRYERGVDWQGTTQAVDRATSLVLESCPKAKASKLFDFQFSKKNKTEISLNKYDVNRLIGLKIDEETIQKLLKRLEFKVTKKPLVFSVPSYRNDDIKIWQDLAEELARLYGYEKISKTELIPKSGVKLPFQFEKRESIKNKLKAIGFSEIRTFALVSGQLLSKLGFDLRKCIKIANPLSEDSEFLRPTLLAGLIQSIARNPWAPEVAVFEIGKVFSLSKESWQLGIAQTGNSIKLSDLLSKLGIKEQAQKVSPEILGHYKIRRSVEYWLIDLKNFPWKSQEQKNIGLKETIYTPFSKFPPTVRDLAFISSGDLRTEKIAIEIKSISKKILLVELFDEYRSEKFGNKKNLAFHIWFQEIGSPIEGKTVDKIILEIIKDVEVKFDAKLRQS